MCPCTGKVSYLLKDPLVVTFALLDDAHAFAPGRALNRLALFTLRHSGCNPVGWHADLRLEHCSEVKGVTAHTVVEALWTNA